MKDQPNAYPLKVTSRTLPSARMHKLRASWFVIGTTFGISCASALSPYIAPLVGAPAFTSAEAPPSVSAPIYTQPILPEVVTGDGTNVATILAPTTDDIGLDAIVAQTPWTEEEPTEAVLTAEQSAETETLAEADGPVQYPVALDLQVESGDTLISLLTNAGVSHDDAFKVVEAVKPIHNPKKLGVGQNVSVTLDKDAASQTPVITGLTLPISATSSVELTRSGDGGAVFAAKKVEAPVEQKLVRAGGRINSSLYETGIASGLPASLLGEVINAYSYDIDFQRDVKQGDSMDVLYERLETEDGTVAGHGSVIFAELGLGDRTLRIYRYVDKSGNADYYNEKGESLRKALLRTPVNGARITSGYGMRNHPLLGYTKMHRGIDFGASVGTPIYAAGDGVVSFVGRKGGYGNYLRINHTGKYASAYAHISRFATGIAPGRKVKQGQIVAYVGKTGMATGPHLHYEILVNNVQVNPANIKFKTGNILEGKELIAFRQNKQKIEAQMAALQRGDTKVAMAQQQPKAKSRN